MQQIVLSRLQHEHAASTGNRYPEAYRGAGEWSREEKLRIFDPHPEIVRQIKGVGEAFFEADWKEGVEDQDW